MNYLPAKDEKSKLFFRIQQQDADGSIKYSVVKTVSMDINSTEMKVYPTVARNLASIYFPNQAKLDFLSVLSLAGQVVQQNSFARTNIISLRLQSGLKPALYLVTVVNKQTNEKQQSKLVIE